MADIRQGADRTGKVLEYSRLSAGQSGPRIYCFLLLSHDMQAVRIDVNATVNRETIGG